MNEKLTKILNQLDKKIVERKDENRVILLSILSGEHILLLGPPGTAKSLTARAFCELIEGGVYFDYLLTRFTTPDEIFGPISVKKLEEDIYIRNTKSYLPSAHVAFLDEIFKASSAILNTLLTIINERKFHNGNKFEEVPLISLIAASNELPSEDEESLQALFDRFVVRLNVDYVQSADYFKNIIIDNCIDSKIDTKINLNELKDLQVKAKLVKVPESIWQIILLIKQLLKEENVIISDRRWQKVVSILKMSAASNKRDEVDESDILLLKFLLINDFKQSQLITYITKKALTEGKISAEIVKSDLNDILNKEDVELQLVEGDTIRDTKKIRIGFKSQFKDAVLKGMLKLLEEHQTMINDGLNELNSRRNNLEDHTEANFWVQWIEITDLVKPIDNEINALNKLKEEIDVILNKIKNPDLENKISIKFNCPRCNQKDGIILNNVELVDEFVYDVTCKNCGRKFTIETE